MCRGMMRLSSVLNVLIFVICELAFKRTTQEEELINSMVQKRELCYRGKYENVLHLYIFLKP